MSMDVADVLAHADEQAPVWLKEHRNSVRDVWTASALPTRKTELWKYTNTRALQQTYLAAPKVVADIQPSLDAVPAIGALRLVFVNGYFSAEHSDSELPEGLECVRFADANDQQAGFISARLGSALPKHSHPFLPLNQTGMNDGLLVNVAPHARLEKPIQVVWLTAGASAPFAVQPRVLVALGDCAQATLIEHFADSAAQASFTNAVTELLLEGGSSLDYYRLNFESGHALHVGGVHAMLGRDATLSSFCLGLGADMKRIDLVANMAQPGAHAQLDGIYLPRGNEHIDYHTVLEHAAPHCTSMETFRGVIADRSRAVFNGRIHIHPNAQKTSAELSNKNLLTSNEAEINTKPELEIYADDVKCAHGATVAQLNDMAVHYLMSRGISKAEAEVMLSFGFVNEVLESTRLTELREALRPLLAERFARDPALLRHLT